MLYIRICASRFGTISCTPSQVLILFGIANITFLGGASIGQFLALLLTRFALDP
jgi:hypothetical protein